MDGNKLDLWNVIVIAFLSVWYLDYRIVKLWKYINEVQQNIWNLSAQIKELKGPGPY